MKKLLIVSTLVLGSIGGYALANTELLGKAAFTKISSSEAKEIATNTFKGQIIEEDFDFDNFTAQYEFEIVSDTEKADVIVDAKTGDAVITEREPINKVASPQPTNTEEQVQEQTNTTTISAEQATEIALKKASGTVTSIELDGLVYEIEIRDGNTEYDIEVHATTGEIVKYEKEIDFDFNK